jgi:hypothetical protein
MTRRAVRPNPQRTPKSLTTQIAAPLKGWSSESSPVEAEEGTALVLDNWFPESEGIRLRRGYAEHAAGMTGDIETLLAYTSASASALFACNDGNIYDVSSAGAVGAAAVSGLSNDKWQHTMFATAAGQFLVAANGADSVRNFDGASWTTPSITALRHPRSFMSLPTNSDCGSRRLIRPIYGIWRQMPFLARPPSFRWEAC